MQVANKHYQLSNHLGNVHVTVTDRKKPMPNNNLLAYYQPDVLTTTDYYSFGMAINDRTANAEGYRYGYQNQEKDDEVKGAGNSINYSYRVHDPRLGRFLSIDPLKHSFPWNSPYAFSENRVIDAIELEGLEAWRLNTYGPSQTSSNTFGPFTDVQNAQAAATAGNAQVYFPFFQVLAPFFQVLA